MPNVNSPRNRRLLADFERMESLHERSKFISFEFFGEPPDRYIITYTCTGIYRDKKSNEIHRSNFHQLEILLHREYPVKAPRLRWLTPIFHPNILPTGGVCINDSYYSVEKKLSEYVLSIGEMIQFKRYNTNNALDREAAAWAVQNQHLFPIGAENLIEVEKVESGKNNKDGHSVIIHNPQNVNLNIATTLSDVKQNIKTIATINQSAKDEFNQLISSLIHELQKTPPEHLDDAEAVAEYAKELVDEVSKEKPKKIRVLISKEGLIKAAENIANVMPTVVQIAYQIVNHVLVNLK